MPPYGCGSRIWTYDLRVMSPTSFQTAPSRDILILYLISQVKPMIGLEPITCWLQISCSANWATSADCLIGKWVVVDSNHRSNLQQIYSLSPLATRESAHVFNYDTCIVYHNRCDYASIFYRNQIIFFNTWIARLGRYFGGGLMPSLSLRYAAKSL